jgi:hypothetical protein
MQKISDVIKLKERLENIFFAQSFDLIVFDQNIVVRKMLDANFSSLPYRSYFMSNKWTETLDNLKKCERRPFLIWDMEQSTKIEDVIKLIIPIINEKQGSIWLSANLADKNRLMVLLQLGVSGLIMKPYTFDALLEKIKSKL